jgi:hypothetical protein
MLTKASGGEQGPQVGAPPMRGARTGTRQGFPTIAPHRMCSSSWVTWLRDSLLEQHLPCALGLAAPQGATAPSPTQVHIQIPPFSWYVPTEETQGGGLSQRPSRVTPAPSIQRPHLLFFATHAPLPLLQCLDFLNGWNVAWMAVYNGNAGTGTAAYYTNGTLATWDSSGVLVNAGNWSVTQVCAPGRVCVSAALCSCVGVQVA